GEPGGGHLVLLRIGARRLSLRGPVPRRLEERAGDAAAIGAAMRVAPLALALVVLVVAADAEAQFGGMGGRRGGMRGGDAGRTQSGERREPIDRLQLMLEELRADLRLSPEQAPR